ncbi:hypothetical protein IHE45_19G133300 [Dioscorea alata]|uniref:Uncharacterized protein n=1 Tax=Dioscorea alata TaxID=55571 RepID=A0ACB7U1V8_DIOAL|nr:hypothetical protein IHE45_19G133300 [Dioscorea alata]
MYDSSVSGLPGYNHSNSARPLKLDGLKMLMDLLFKKNAESMHIPNDVEREREKGTHDDYDSPPRSVTPSPRDDRDYRLHRQSPSPDQSGRSPSRSRSYSPR